jgi:ubiquinone/menaquinone biosynthesis C-methylase UbiE
MKISRRQTLIFHYILDNLFPPALRDADWLMRPIFRVLFGKKASIFIEWKEKAPSMEDDEFARVYREVEDVLVQRTTSLNDACLDQIMKNVVGKNLLEVGCGNGFLSNLLSEASETTAVDIIINQGTREAYPHINFQEANMERLPFADESFDTVVSTHTLEHVKNLPAAMHELRRVTRTRLILVTPKQRPYKYTFDLHLNFFPYPHSLVQAVGHSIGQSSCRVAGGDLFYMESRQEN